MTEIKIEIQSTVLLNLQKEMEDKTILKGCHMADFYYGKKKKKIKAK